MPRYVVWIFSVVLMALGPCVASGQKYFVKPIRIVSTGSAGSSTDFAVRLIAQGLSGTLGQPVIVEIRAEQIANDIVRQAPPDGYTLMGAGAGYITTPLLRKTSYDPVKDFSPITLAVSPPYILAVNPSLKATSVKELIGLAKAKPGALNFGSSGVGGAAHLAAELFKVMAGVNIVHVPYKGSPVALADLVGGQIQLVFYAPSLVLPHVNAGRLRALAVTSAQPSELAPGLPTVAATLPGYETSSMVGIFAPAKTSVVIINRLNEEIVRVLNQANTKEKLLGMGVEVVGNSPGQFAATIKSEMTKWGKLIKDLGLRDE